MSLIKFFQIIDNTFIGKFVDRKLKFIEETDPQRIYVENVRSFYNLPHFAAKFFCEMAVKEHLFRKKIAVNCPDCGRVIKTYNNPSEIPTVIECEHCQLLEKDNYQYKLSKKDIMEYYQLIEE